MTEERLKQIEEQLEGIKQRNLRVEADKAWEASSMRIGAICTMTYMIACAFLYTMGADRFYIHALVPPVGFYLSTQSLPAIKKWWIENRFVGKKSL